MQAPELAVSLQKYRQRGRRLLILGRLLLPGHYRPRILTAALRGGQALLQNSECLLSKHAPLSHHAGSPSYQLMGGPPSSTGL